MNDIVILISDLTAADVLAFGWFVLAWAGYSLYAERSKKRNLMQLLTRYRYAWMRAMVGRDMRMADLMAAGNIASSVTFFASTTLLIVGGLIGVLGVSTKVLDVVNEFPLAAETTKFAVELKLMLMVTIFVYAFFKFTWSVRQFNYLAIYMGGAPDSTTPDAEAEDYARKGAKLVEMAANHLNEGLRAYYFGIAVLSWFLGPEIFAFVTAWVVGVLYRREFLSKTRAVLDGR